MCAQARMWEKKARSQREARWRGRGARWVVRGARWEMRSDEHGCECGVVCARRSVARGVADDEWKGGRSRVGARRKPGDVFAIGNDEHPKRPCKRERRDGATQVG